MRGTRAKALRRDEPTWPNPGRKFGGSTKVEAKAKAGHKGSIRKFKRLMKKRKTEQNDG